MSLTIRGNDFLDKALLELVAPKWIKNSTLLAMSIPILTILDAVDAHFLTILGVNKKLNFLKVFLANRIASFQALFLS